MEEDSEFPPLMFPRLEAVVCLRKLYGRGANFVDWWEGETEETLTKVLQIVFECGRYDLWVRC